MPEVVQQAPPEQDAFEAPAFDAVVDKVLDDEGIDLEDDEDVDTDPPEPRSDDTEDEDLPPEDEDEDPEYEYDDEDEDEYEAPDDDEEEEEETGEDEEADEDDDEDEDFLEDARLTRKQREQIEEDPLLKKAHASMQRAFTQKTQDIAVQRRELREREKAVDQFNEAFQDAKTFTALMTRVMRDRLDIGAAAFEGVATSEDREAFFIEAGLQDPKPLLAAAERVQALQEDPEALERHNSATKLRAQQQQLADRERRLNARVTQRDKARIESTATRLSRRLGIDKADMDIVLENLEQDYRGKVSRDDGSIDFDEAAVRSSVKKSKQQLDRVYRRIADRQRKRQVRKSKTTAKRRAKTRNTRRTVPRQRAGRKATNKRRPKKAPGRDATQAQRDEHFDAMLGHTVNRRLR